VNEIARVGKRIDFFKANAIARRMKLLRDHQVSLVLDVGANTGQYTRALRRAGYRGRVVSFEPVMSAYVRLARNARRSSKWTALRMALGDRNHDAPIHVSGDSRASSLLQMLPAHLRVARYFETQGQERVPVRTLDSVLDGLSAEGDRTFLKIDAQGYELKVLKGARRALKRIQGLQLEMSLVPLYRGETLLPKMVALLNELGFSLMSLEYGFCDPRTGRMLQVDGIFFRERLSSRRRRRRER
jgi:FkbM family methyltransferase